MKVIILSIIVLISTINASQRLLKSVSVSCATIKCKSGTFCTEDVHVGAKCVSSCGNNEEYKQCGTACPEKCGDTGSQMCTLQCVEGCFCKNGFILDFENGNCIPENECPINLSTNTPICGDNEEYNICGTACPKKCGDSVPIICTLQCVIGCFCKDGYILDEEDGNCIPENECPHPTTTFDPVCPLRCKSGFNGCNNCFCDGLGNIDSCNKIGCQNETIAPPGCKTCEVGYVLNTVTNECESGKFLYIIYQQLYTQLQRVILQNIYTEIHNA